ncbi:MAG: 4-(cytidine 5'-diphospho)-2-C-methyl-D-erythritol kinase [Ruminiclostridium sp.]
MSLRVKAYAKINLWLDITGRLENGYHSLNTVMRQIDLYDTVTLTPTAGSEIEIICDNPAIPTDRRNIVYKAAEAFFGAAGFTHGIKLEIEKKIPVEAGMGGSSTDGAAVLTGLNLLFGNPLTVDRLCEIGGKIGADVPFCIVGGTAECGGIGEVKRKLFCSDFAIAVIKPDFSCNTALAYKSWDERPIETKAGFSQFCGDLSKEPKLWAGSMYNVFEVLQKNPEIDRIKAQLLESGALGAAMTGSGSAVFGVFQSLPEAQTAIKNIPYGCKFAVNAL